jgi:Na+/alanine symporter
MKKSIQIILFCILPGLLLAQDANGSEDFFGSIGKIYVVVGVLLILFLSIIAFLVTLERRIARLEAEEEYN